MLRLKLHWQILIALILAVFTGMIAGPEGAIFGLKFVDGAAFVGTLFLNALKMLIVPLIASSIIVGIMGVGDEAGLGRLGLKTISYYLLTTLLAVVVGLVLVNLIQPGTAEGGAANTALGLPVDVEPLSRQIEATDGSQLAEVFLRMIPPNIVQAAAQGQMLGLIFFSLLFGYFSARIERRYASALKDFWQGVFQVMMGMTDLIMKFAPIGVFALVSKVVAVSGTEVFEPLALFFITVLTGLAVHLLITMPLILMVLGHVNPWRHYRAMLPALLTAFSTSSSSATLPITMECVERNAGVSNRVSSFVLPLGATINMDGTALYECVAAMFIAQAYGIELSLVQQFTVVVLALATSIGVAGIPAASLVAITIILTAIGLPIEAVGLILAVDRLLDMCRTAVNVFSDSCGTVVIARSEGEPGVLKGA